MQIFSQQPGINVFYDMLSPLADYKFMGMNTPLFSERIRSISVPNGVDKREFRSWPTPSNNMILKGVFCEFRADNAPRTLSGFFDLVSCRKPESAINQISVGRDPPSKTS